MLSARFECGAPPTATDETPGAPDQATAAHADETDRTRALLKYLIFIQKITKVMKPAQMTSLYNDSTLTEI